MFGDTLGTVSVQCWNIVGAVFDRFYYVFIMCVICGVVRKQLFLINFKYVFVDFYMCYTCLYVSFIYRLFTEIISRACW